jgi:hypothetical protein
MRDRSMERKGESEMELHGYECVRQRCWYWTQLLGPDAGPLVLYIPFIPPNPSREWNKQQEIVTLSALARVSHIA